VDEKIDTSDPQGLANLYGRFATAETESIKISTRVSRGITERAAQGKPHHGRRLFGYSNDYQLVPDEVKEAKRIIRRILKGETLSAVARDLNQRGVQTASGGQWTGSSVRQWASSPALAGIRRHRTVEDRKAGRPGTETQGTWKRIITLAEREALQIRLGDPHPGSGEKTAIRWLLSGIARCGSCGERMHVHTGTQRYTCSAVGGKGCGKVAASVDRVDEVVIGRLLAFSANAQVEPLPEEDPEKLRAEIAADEARLETLNRARFVEGVITAEEWQPARDELTNRLASSREALAGLENRSSLRTGSLEDLADWWEGSTVEEQRQAETARPRSDDGGPHDVGPSGLVAVTTV